VNQQQAIKLLQSLRESNPVLAAHLQVSWILNSLIRLNSIHMWTSEELGWLVVYTGE